MASFTFSNHSFILSILWPHHLWTVSILLYLLPDFSYWRLCWNGVLSLAKINLASPMSWTNRILARSLRNLDWLPRFCGMELFVPGPAAFAAANAQANWRKSKKRSIFLDDHTRRRDAKIV
jgi:hypothetical protein